MKKEKILRKMRETEQLIRKLKAEDLQTSRPLISINKCGLIHPNTLVGVQGKAGSHKSRIAGAFASVLISTSGCTVSQRLARHRDSIAVIYFDTERNLTEQFPLAIQNILANAGFSKKDNPANFSYTSLADIPRDKRRKALKVFIDYARKQYADKHIVFILDVFSDFVNDFNNSMESLKILDYVNALINKSDCTAIVVIHENPGSSKARGHLGTELRNKASTIIQMNYHEDMVVMSLVKSRNSKADLTSAFIFDDRTKQLVYQTNLMGSTLAHLKKRKQFEVATCQVLGTTRMQRKVLIATLAEKLGKGERGIKDLLMECKNEVITSISGMRFKLLCSREAGDKNHYYSLGSI